MKGRCISIVAAIILLFILIPCGSPVSAANGETMYNMEVTQNRQDLYPMSALRNGKYLWGYADKTGKFSIEPKYSYASEWNGEFGIVSLPEETELCFVIDREGERISFVFPFEKEPLEYFPATYTDDKPNLWFCGEFLIAPELTGDPYAGNSIFNLPDRIYTGSTNFQSYSEGMLGTWYRDNAGWLDCGNGTAFSSYGQGGAFYNSVAVKWGGLLNKSGETVYEYTFPWGNQGDQMLVYGLDSMTNWVGDSLVFIKPKWSKDGWDIQGYGVVRADGKLILPGEYSYARLTPCKQILAGKKGQTYLLYDADGKELYKFPTYMTGAFSYDGTGHYMYRATDGNIVVVSTTGAVTAKLPIHPEARAEFISGFVRITGKEGSCRYYDVNGNLVLGK